MSRLLEYSEDVLCTMITCHVTGTCNLTGSNIQREVRKSQSRSRLVKFGLGIPSGQPNAEGKTYVSQPIQSALSSGCLDESQDTPKHS
jgi:hypothetical protein